MAIILSDSGRQKAWELNPNQSFEGFKRKQKIIGWVSLLVFLILFSVGAVKGFYAASVGMKVNQGEVSKEEGYFQIAKSRDGRINDFEEFKKGFTSGSLDGQKPNLEEFVISEDVKSSLKDIKTNISFFFGYSMGFGEACMGNTNYNSSNSSEEEKIDKCKSLLTEKLQK